MNILRKQSNYKSKTEDSEDEDGEYFNDGPAMTKIRKSKIDRKCRNFKGKLIATSKFTTEITLTLFCEIDS